MSGIQAQRNEPATTIPDLALEVLAAMGKDATTGLYTKLHSDS